MIRKYILTGLWLMLAAVPCKADRFQYDKLDRLVKVTYDNGCTISYEYDAFGNVLKKTTTGPDTSKPKLVKPDTMLITLKSGEISTKVQFPVSAVDAVDPEVQVICTPASGSLLGVGRYIVKCKAVTARGVTVTDSFKLTIKPAQSTATDSAAVATAKTMHKESNKVATEASNASTNMAFSNNSNSSLAASSLISRDSKNDLLIDSGTTTEKSPVLAKKAEVSDTLTALSGIFGPPIDGVYVFTMIGAPGCQLLISPTQDPAAKVLMLESTIDRWKQSDTTFVALELYKDIRQYIEVRAARGAIVKLLVKVPGSRNKELPGAFFIPKE